MFKVGDRVIDKAENLEGTVVTAQLDCFFGIGVQFDNREVENEYYTHDGRPYLGADQILFQTKQKKSGWFNFYFIDCDYQIMDCYKTEEAAKKHAMPGVLATVFIEWEE